MKLSFNKRKCLTAAKNTLVVVVSALISYLVSRAEPRYPEVVFVACFVFFVLTFSRIIKLKI